MWAKCVLVGGLLALAPLTVLAAEGRIPVPFEAPIAFPITIDSPGRYVMTRSLTNTGSGSIISIDGGSESIAVVLDLNGMTLDNTSDPAAPVVNVLNGDVTIRGGALVGGQVGIQAAAGTRKIAIEDTTIRDTAGGGMRLTDVDFAVVRRATVLDTGSFGLELHGAETKQVSIEDSLFRGTSGISLSGVTGARVWNNRIQDSSARPPIELIGSTSCLVQTNTISEATGVCIRLENATGNRLADNLISSCTGHGIELFGASDGNSLVGHVVRGGGDDGIRVGGQGNRLDSNEITGNAGWGIYFERSPPGSNAYGRNVAFDNGGTGCIGGSRAGDICDNAGPLDVNNKSFGDNLVPPWDGLI